MADNLQDDFDKEEDLAAAFENEADLAAPAPTSLPSDSVDPAAEEQQFNNSWDSIAGTTPQTPAPEMTTDDSNWLEKRAHELQKSPLGVVQGIGDVEEMVANAPEVLGNVVDAVVEPGDPNTSALKAYLLNATPSELLSAAQEKWLAKLHPEFLGGLSSEEYADVYGNRSLLDLSKANREQADEYMKGHPVAGMLGKATVPVLTGAAAGPLAASASMMGLAGVDKAERKLEEGGTLDQSATAFTRGLTGQGLLDLATRGVVKGGSKLLPSRSAATAQTLRSLGISPQAIAAMSEEQRAAILAAVQKEGAVGPLTHQPKAASTVVSAVREQGQQLEALADNISNELKAMQAAAPVKAPAPEVVAAKGPKIKGSKSKAVPFVQSNPVDTAVQGIIERLKKLEIGTTDINKLEIQQRIKMLEEIAKASSEEGGISFKRLQDFKKALGKDAFTDTGMPRPTSDVLADMYEVVSGATDDLAAQTKFGAEYLQKNAHLSKLFRAKRLMNPRANDSAATFMNKLLKRPETLTGAAVATAAAIGGLKTGGMMLVPAWLASRYGSQTAAWMSRGMSKLRPVLESNPKLLGKFAPVLAKAYKDGKEASTNYILATTYPEYTEMLKSVDEQYRGPDEQFSPFNENPVVQNTSSSAYSDLIPADAVTDNEIEEEKEKDDTFTGNPGYAGSGQGSKGY